jgi:hypothetical protein
MGALAFKIKDIDDDVASFEQTCAATKECSGCDPDIPGHQERASCTVCSGTRREPLSFAAAYAEVVESKREEACQKQNGNRDYCDDEDDTPGDLEY